ncbi:insulinase family protein [Siccirubricoccus sp. KC 17139]|uniref:Insulinase family protein n=1 Tax=Siccirubricoccus soli TaxID=2899147 RepID=A0ABT1CY23_9PROT|nr:pitrilysin family protein [Siccirubricoccus soli]MCO6414567.1 insulinase family protein [Siccirubricoccus soli]MCP2680697.1 insulinase family protein [Siccirubricoccus soli]
MTRRTAIAAAGLLPTALATSAPAQPAASSLLPSSAPPRDRPLFGATSWSLPNGLRVVLAESRRVPVVSHFLFYAAGAGEDPAGRSGLAHFLEHMMFKGSPHVAPGAFSLAVAREGGQDNAFTSRDVTAYHQTVEASRLPLVMRMEADRFAGPLLPAGTVEPERAVVLEERRQRTDSNPRARFYEAFEAALFGPQHWRGRPIIGWEEEIRALTRDDLHSFYERRYAPANATLVVTGDVREAELRRLAEEFYAPVPARAAVARDRAPPPAQAVEPRLIRRDPAVREATFLRAYMAPSLTWGDADQAWALELLAHLLGSGPGSRLYKALVETGLATSAGASYDSEAMGVAAFTISATTRPGIAPEALEAAVDAVLAKLVQEGPAEAERARSARQLTAGALLALDGIGAAPRMLGGALAIGLPLETVEYWPARLRAVTLDQVTVASRAVLGGAPSTTGWLLPGTAS